MAFRIAARSVSSAGSVHAAGVFGYGVGEIGLDAGLVHQRDERRTRGVKAGPSVFGFMPKSYQQSEEIFLPMTRQTDKLPTLLGGLGVEVEGDAPRHLLADLGCCAVERARPS